VPILSSKRPSIDRKVIVITGASSGIGLATARRAAAAGAAVMLVARNGDALARIAAEIREVGGTADHVVADVGVAADVERAADATIARYGRINCWISNAGVAIYATLENTPLAEHERLFRTNYFGTVHSALAALPHLRAVHGQLIVIGSIASELPSPLLGAYSASKHAVKAYVDSLRAELIAAGDSVLITLVKPSGIDTPIGEHAANHQGKEALVPPPVYHVEVAAKAIVDAIENPRRELTIGGVGRLNVLAVAHFPRLLDHLARFLIPLLTNPSRPPTPTDNLFQPAEGGLTRSKNESGRTFSFYTAVARHRPAATLMVGLAAMGGAALFLGRSATDKAAAPKQP
jgi:short-subunit dehydrogenase